MQLFDNYFPASFVAFASRHPRLMLLALVVVALVGWAILFEQGNKAIVVYQGF
jgi:hypothetical protein